MTNIKDKLSASVRQARAGQQAGPEAAAEAPASKAPARRTAASKEKVAVPSKPTASKPVDQKPVVKPVPRATESKVNNTPESGSALFPQRVWPD
jgi:hypothetical protein